MSDFDPTTVRGVRVLVACDYCHEKGRLPGGKYKSQGEVVDCPVCNGRKMVEETITLSMLYDLLNGNIVAARGPGEIK